MTMFKPDYIKDLVKNKKIWKEYEIAKSPGDGHCLLHSILTGLKIVMEESYTEDKLINSIRNELMNN